MTCEIVYYSATEATAKIVRAFAEGLGGEVVFTRIDMLSYQNATASNADLLLLASPVYGGRIPDRVMKCFERKCAAGIRVAGIAVYGNMHFGASLMQLRELAQRRNASLIGAGAFIAEHTFSFKDAPIAEGRPNASDLSAATQFGQAVRQKIAAADRSDAELPPSGFPLFLTKLPETSVRPVVKKPVITGACTRCGICAKTCPTHAIDPDTLAIDAGKCIRCFSCVKKCPPHARKAELRLKSLRHPFAKIGSRRRTSVWHV